LYGDETHLTRSENDVQILSVDVGATWTRIAFVKRGAIVRRHARVPTPQSGFKQLIDLIEQALKSANGDIAAIVLGIPGPVDYSRRKIIKLPNLPAWDCSTLSEALSSLTALSILPVNDADLAALGEHGYGAGNGVPNLVFLSCGSGVGAGVILNGRLASGRYSLGEIGHAIIDLKSHKTIEQLVSGIAARQLLDERMLQCKTESNISLLEENMGLCEISYMQDVFAQCARMLALCFMPDRLVVGGGYASSHPELIAAARNEISRIEVPLSLRAENIVEAQLGDDAAILGGFAYWALTAKEGI
jgi:glucokinase